MVEDASSVAHKATKRIIGPAEKASGAQGVDHHWQAVRDRSVEVRREGLGKDKDSRS
jgi:hypothetical protein